MKVWWPLLFVFSSAWAYVDETIRPITSFTPYRPTYFLSGEPDTKAQVSFKFPLLKQVPLHFAYSQLMMWDLFKKSSSPIRDVNANPDIFYRLDLGQHKWRRRLDLGLYEHESNGKADAASRSWDRFYLRYEQFADQQNPKFHGSIKVWLPFNKDANNQDILYYRGLGELNLTFFSLMPSWFVRDYLTLRIYPGGNSHFDFTKGGQELTWRGSLKGDSFLPMLVLQFFHGTGENLLDYRDEHLGLRGGIGF